MTDVGYATRFPRVLRRFTLFAVAFSIVSITTGIVVNFAEIIGTVVLSVVVFLAWVRVGPGTPDGGHGFGFLLIMAFSMFALIVVAAAANSRLTFAMARDGMLPFSALLRRVHPDTVPAPLVSLGVCVALMGYGAADGNAFAVLVGATALVPYLIYVLTLGGYLARRRTLPVADSFRLGAAALPVAGSAMLWLVAVVAALTLPEALRSADYVVLGALALTGLWYVGALRKRLRDGTAGTLVEVP
ncbi:amino acid permease [Pseudonocardia saturnea]